MPRKTKEQNETENEKSKTTTAKEPAEKTTKKATVAKSAKTSTAKKEATKTETTKKSNASTKKTTDSTKKSTAKKSTATKKATNTKASSKKAATTKATGKKTATTKSASKKSTATKKTTRTRKTTRKATNKKLDKKIEIVEYYDLPYRYNQTVVKVLAQTPTTLFIYWDISDKDRKNFENQYGEKFFENTRPILIIHNDTLGYSFEVGINDFANSWYLHVADAKCDYRIELGRRPIIKNEQINTDYIYVATSNEIEAPNDHILFNKEQKMVYFRDVKTGKQTQKPINTISFMRNMGKIYNIYDLYKELYQNENIEEIYDLSNPSSGNPSSGSLSSQFK